MTYQEALDHFHSGRAIADALGLTPGRVSQCKTAGGFSYQQQCVLEKASDGVVKARHEDVPAQQSSVA